jgi:hypothetical protein
MTRGLVARYRIVAVPTRERGMVSDNDKAYLGSKSGVPIRVRDGL